MGRETTISTVVIFYLGGRKKAIKSVYNHEGRKLVEEEIEDIEDVSVEGSYMVHRGLENITVYVVSNRSIKQEKNGNTLRIIASGGKEE